MLIPSTTNTLIDVGFTFVLAVCDCAPTADTVLSLPGLVIVAVVAVEDKVGLLLVALMLVLVLVLVLSVVLLLMLLLLLLLLLLPPPLLPLSLPLPLLVAPVTFDAEDADEIDAVTFFKGDSSGTMVTDTKDRARFFPFVLMTILAPPVFCSSDPFLSAFIECSLSTGCAA